MRLMGKVLVVDDDPVFLTMMEEVLSQNSYEVVLQQSGINALEVINKEQPDLVILDIIMPDKEGLETINDIRAKDMKLPVVVVSGISNIDYLDMAMDFGADAMLTKPIDKSVLLNLVKDLI